LGGWVFQLKLLFFYFKHIYTTPQDATARRATTAGSAQAKENKGG
jgi:hypothetical protein